MAAVTELEIYTTVRAKAIAAGGWFATAGLKFHFGRRPPNADTPPYMVIAVEEQDEPDTEADGETMQKFMVEMAIRAVGPDDAEAASAALPSLDPKWGADTGLTIDGAYREVTGVTPKSGKLRLLEPLQAGEDQYTATRRWEVWTSAFLGA